MMSKTLVGDIRDMAAVERACAGVERLPYPIRHLDDYGHTKALAEQDVIRANFGYEPIVLFDQAQLETIAWLRQTDRVQQTAGAA